MQTALVSSSLASASLALAVFALASPAAAQDLVGTVERNPDDTVTYTIDLDGPPAGTAYVFAGTGLTLFPKPLPLPGLIGELYLDPLFALSLGAMPLDGAGQGQLKLTHSSVVTDGLGVYFQALVIDSTWQLALSSLSATYHTQTSAPAAPLAALTVSNQSPASIDGAVEAAPGTPVRVEHWAPNFDWLKGAEEFLVGPEGAHEFGVALSTPVQFCDTTRVMVLFPEGWQPYLHLPWHKE